jgi:LacI family sucrose operon transcriptional repressor
MGGVQASGLLYKNECDIFLLLNTPTQSDVPGFGRVQGFIDTCNEHSLDYRILQYNMANDYESMAESVKQTLNNYVIDSYPGKRKGIFCLSDTCAIIVENNLIKKYGFLPDDYRIIGFDNTPASMESVLPITTIGQQADVMVDTAMQMLIEQIERKNSDSSAFPGKPVHRVIPPKMIIRDTTK